MRVRTLREDTEGAEEAVSPLSASTLKHNFEGSPVVDDLESMKGLLPMAGEIVSADDDKMPLRPVDCN